MPMSEVAITGGHELATDESEMPGRADGHGICSIALHLGYDREAEGDLHTTGGYSSVRPSTHYYIFDLKR